MFGITKTIFWHLMGNFKNQNVSVFPKHQHDLYKHNIKMSPLGTVGLLALSQIHILTYRETKGVGPNGDCRLRAVQSKLTNALLRCTLYSLGLWEVSSRFMLTVLSFDKYLKCLYKVWPIYPNLAYIFEDDINTKGSSIWFIYVESSLSTVQQSSASCAKLEPKQASVLKSITK